ncbi:hypothetical protein [Echinicola vietnamensis]|uniref:Protein SirB1 N-terminal domain-containing protein n=1 Tax=Echinicola vietnamensis (strain DSM 17526 / LMG 23754 / KMM 6221) TaxID=926556 RepID=L0FV13_ECHVK|nr:hypothetical protein [Echinicola vietnamensis]AGA76586.1 hypothetical protein Echvi_0295 [Echinicola vietnamensis DSM 17526]
MKRLLICVVVVFAGICHAMSQEWDLESSVFENAAEKQLFLGDPAPKDLLMALHAAEHIETASLDKLIEKLDKRSQKKEYTEWFLEEVFYKAHQYVLKTYIKHSSFNEALTTGAYDCVSGSAIYGLLLDRYGFDFEVIETDYHVFLLVHVEDGKTYVFESTEPRAGFIKDQEAVAEYISFFNHQVVRGKTKQLAELGSVMAQFTEYNTIYTSISLRELAGLQYYNDAVHHFNEGDVAMAYKQLAKAKSLYPSDRVVSLYDYMAAVREGDKKLAGR